jgi:DNA-directed RNA polymerase subunit M/transcription elongation factor TFIIS
LQRARASVLANLATVAHLWEKFTMTRIRRYIELRCRACSYVTECNPAELHARIQQVGLLRRVNDPAWELLCELLPSAAARFRCPDCQHLGMSTALLEENDDDWAETRNCRACGKPIPAERLELFPQANMCAACQQQDDAKTSDDDPQYCPKCGALMIVRQRRGSGITRYAIVCPECGR